MTKLFEFEYEIVYQPSKKNKVADALSRREGSPMLWIMYKEDDPSLSALSKAKWRVWDKLEKQ